VNKEILKDRRDSDTPFICEAILAASVAGSVLIELCRNVGDEEEVVKIRLPALMAVDIEEVEVVEVIPFETEIEDML
jgi:hypothetical protein